MASASEATIYRKKYGVRSLSVHGSTYERLRELGKTADSFDDVISRLIDEHEERKNKMMLLQGVGATNYTSQATSDTTGDGSPSNDDSR